MCSNRFRPLIGVSFCKRPLSLNKICKVINVSVPLSGLVSVNVIEVVKERPQEKVSVPLSGLVSVNQ